MSRKSVTMIYHWGGNIFPDNDLGVTYEGGNKSVLRVKIGTKYNNLVRKLYEITGINPSVEKLVLSCRYPTFISPQFSTFMQLLIDNDDSVDAMLSVVIEHVELSAVYLFIETVHVGSSSQNLESQHLSNIHYHELPANDPTPSHHEQHYDNPYPSSSQYTNPTYENPPTISSQDYREALQPQSSLDAVVALLHCTEGNNSSDNDESDGSDAEEMASVDSEIEVVAGSGASTSTNSEGRMYTPMNYYTEPQKDMYEKDHDWEAPPNYRNRTIFDPKSHDLNKGLLFRSKDQLPEAVKMFNIHAKREYTVRVLTRLPGKLIVCMPVPVIFENFVPAFNEAMECGKLSRIHPHIHVYTLA